jgi:predicted lipid-binding transport protein (Tim44 family)
MRFVTLASAALFALLLTGGDAWAQAGRLPVPAPRVPASGVPGGGGGVRAPYLPVFVPLGCGEYLFWGLAAVGGLVALVFLGARIGEALAGKRSPAPANRSPANPASSAPPLQINWHDHVLPWLLPRRRAESSAPPLKDLILQPAEVEEKARRTTQVLEALARRDTAFDPSLLREFVTETFVKVQKCWEAQDYGPVSTLLGPQILAKHQELLQAMRNNHEINRIEDLRVLRLEFVHVSYPPAPDCQEVTALITFEARVYFVSYGLQTFRHGSTKILPYQEFWVFRRDGTGWRLEAIEQSQKSDRLEAANRVDG